MIEFKAKIESVEFPEPLEIVISFPIDIRQLEASTSKQITKEALNSMLYKFNNNVGHAVFVQEDGVYKNKS